MTMLLQPAVAPFRDASSAEPLDLDFQLVTDGGQLATWTDEWRRLLAASGTREPMLSPEWLMAWWELYGAHRSLALGLFHCGGQLVGLAPMCMRPHRYRAGLTFQRLGFLGADGDEPDGVCSDYLNLVVRTGFEERVAHAFAGRLLDGSFGAWDECVLENMDGDGTMPEFLMSAFTLRGQTVSKTETTVAPFASLPGTWEAFHASLPKKKRSSQRTAWRDFETWSEGEFRLDRARDAESLAKGRAILKSLHQQRWEDAGQSGVFASARFDAFHDRWMRSMLSDASLELAWLSVRGEPIAAAYGFRANGRIYYYQCGRKLGMPPRIRPGIVLLQLLIKDAISGGEREFDFLGGPARYKSLFANSSRPLVQLRIARTCWRERLRRMLVACKSWLARCRMGRTGSAQ